MHNCCLFRALISSSVVRHPPALRQFYPEPYIYIGLLMVQLVQGPHLIQGYHLVKDCASENPMPFLIGCILGIAVGAGWAYILTIGFEVKYDEKDD